MRYGRFGDSYVIRLDPGEDIPGCLSAFVNDRRIDVGSVSGFGSAAAIELGRLAGPGIQVVAGPADIVSLVGNVTVQDGRPRPRLAVVVVEPDGTTRGGELRAATVASGCEVVVRPLPGFAQRRRQEPSGDWLLDL